VDRRQVGRKPLRVEAHLQKTSRLVALFLLPHSTSTTWSLLDGQGVPRTPHTGSAPQQDPLCSGALADLIHYVEAKTQQLFKNATLILTPTTPLAASELNPARIQSRS
jgi:hypothetical protein